MRDTGVITLYEFERKPVRELRELGLNITGRELMRFAEVVNSLYGMENPVLTVEYDPRKDEYYLRTHGNVGFSYYFDRDRVVLIQILPKPFKHDKGSGRSLRFFLHLLNMHYQMNLSPKEIKTLSIEYGRRNSFDELFKYLYVLMLSKALSRGLYYEYGEREEHSQTLKGRIMMNELVRKPPWKTELPMKYSLLMEDNPLNRVLKGALKATVRSARLNETRKVGGMLLDVFRNVGEPTERDFARVSFNHLNERFKTVFRLATAIYFGLRLDRSSRFLPGMFVRMDELFETLVYKTLKAALGHEAEVRFQMQLPHVIKNAKEVEARFKALFMMGNPLPDIVIATDSGTCVVEVKYRNLYIYHRGENRHHRKIVRKSEELYQVYTYSRLVGEYRKTGKVPVLLVYPRLEGVYNHWIPDIFSARPEEVFEFFDGTKIGIFGYELSAIGSEILLRRNSVILDDETTETLKSFLLSLCSSGSLKAGSATGRG